MIDSFSSEHEGNEGRQLLTKNPSYNDFYIFILKKRVKKMNIDIYSA